MRAVSAREANQSFSQILQEAESGAEIVITRRGKPVATIGPYRSEKAADREAAIERIIELMKKGLPFGGRRFTRDEMHER